MSLLFKQVKDLVYKDILIEWRSKYALNSVILYIVSTVFVCYQTFNSVDTLVWNALFWIILLFASINAMSRSFSSESSNRFLFYYTLASAKAVILAKIIYNTGLMILLTGIAFVTYLLVFKNPVQDFTLYAFAVLLGSISFATVFTMVSSISAKAGNNSTLMAILSFPVIIPLLIVLIKLSSNAIEGLERAISYREIGLLLFINIITVTISLLLFPYLWRD